MADFRGAFPYLAFRATADLIAEGDYVVGQWEGGGTHTGALCGRRRCGVLVDHAHRGNDRVIPR